MKRTENHLYCKNNNIQMVDDCLVFEFSKPKEYNMLDEYMETWNMYANKFQPEICLVLAMARYILIPTYFEI